MHSLLASSTPRSHASTPRASPRATPALCRAPEPGASPRAPLRVPPAPYVRPCRAARSAPQRLEPNAFCSCVAQRPRPMPPARPCRLRAHAACAPACTPMPPERPACAHARLPHAQWAVAHFRFCIFFFSFIFFSSMLLENHPKKYIFVFVFVFHFPVPPNKFIKIYFIPHFFPVYTL